MSKGPGTIERRIADLFAATRDRALDVSEIARHAFGAKSSRPGRSEYRRPGRRIACCGG
jgi:hypothetical protein